MMLILAGSEMQGPVCFPLHIHMHGVYDCFYNETSP